MTSPAHAEAAWHSSLAASVNCCAKSNGITEQGHQIGILVAWYWPDSWAFRVCPINDPAREHCEDPEDFTERGYVKQLYRLRRLKLMRSLQVSLLDVPPPSNGARWRNDQRALNNCSDSRTAGIDSHCSYIYSRTGSRYHACRR